MSITTPDPATTAFPLTRAQQGIVDGCQLQASPAVMNLAQVTTIVGGCEVQRLARACRRAMAEFAGTRIRVVAGMQRVVKPSNSDVTVVAVDSEADAEHIIRNDVGRPLDIGSDALCRHIIFDLGTRVLWYHRAHHVALDGYAFGLITARVGELYRAQGQMSDGASDVAVNAVEDYLEMDAAHDGDIAALIEVVRADRGSAKSCGSSRDYWIEQLAALPEPKALSIPTDPTDPEEPRRGNTKRETVTLAHEVFAGIEACASSARVTWADVIFAAVAVLVYRRTGQNPVQLGVPIAGRVGAAAVTPTCLVNACALVVSVSPSDTLLGLARTMARQRRADRAHQGYRHEDVRRDIGRVGGGRRLFGPSVNIMVGQQLELPNAQASTSIVAAGPVEDVAFGVYVHDLARGIVELSLDTAPGRRAEGHLDEFVAIVNDMVQHPEEPIYRLGVPEHVVGTPTTSGVTHWSELLQAHTDAATSAEREGGLLARARIRAAELKELGVHAGNVIGIDDARSIDHVIEAVAVSLTGAGYATTDIVSGAGECGSDTAYIARTSGSTGDPKDIIVSHRALAHFVRGACEVYGWTSDDVVLHFALLSADTSVEEIFPAVVCGANIVVASEQARRDPSALVRQCAGVTVLDLPTSVWHELVPAWVCGALPFPDSVRQIIIGGEAVKPSIVALWRKHFKDSVQLLTTYGPSETTVVATYADLTDPSVPADTLGDALPGVGVSVIDNEVWIIGSTVAEGYRDREPFHGVYRTGDLVEWAGYWRFCGRRDDQRKIGGYRVNPRAVEQLIDAVVGVRHCAVTATSSGLHAWVVFDEGCTIADVQATLTGRIPEVAIPVVIPVSKIPLTDRGKVDTAALSAADPTRTCVAVSRAADAQAPFERHMALIATVFSEVLGRPMEYDDNLFDCGAQSLMAVTLAARLSVELSREVPAAVIFDHPTARTLSEALGASDGGNDEVPADLRAVGDEIAADLACAPPSAVAPRKSGARTFLLTGATGTVGRAIYAALTERGMRVIAGIRSGTDFDGPSIHCDLDQAGVGIAIRDLADVTDIINCAAYVAGLPGYRAFRSSVRAVHDLTRIACDEGIALHHISSVAAGRRPPEHGMLADPFRIPLAYAAAKSVAEHHAVRAMEAGMAGSVLRLGRVLTRDGTDAKDVIRIAVEISRHIRVVPQLDIREPICFADDVAHAIVTGVMGLRTSALVEVSPAVDVEVGSVFGALHLPVVPIEQWLEAARAACIAPDRLALVTKWCDLVVAYSGEGWRGIWNAPAFRETTVAVDRWIVPAVTVDQLRCGD